MVDILNSCDFHNHFMHEDDIKVDLDTFNVPEKDDRPPEMHENKLISVYCKSDHTEDLKDNLSTNYTSDNEKAFNDDDIVVQEMSFDHEETTFGIIEINDDIKRETDCELKTDDCDALAVDANQEGNI